MLKPPSKLKLPNGGGRSIPAPKVEAKPAKATQSKLLSPKAQKGKLTVLAKTEQESPLNMTKELELKHKLDREKKEEKRKMMEERKLLLKKKLSAIKIQKFWKMRRRRRNLKLDHLKFISAVRRIQR